MKLYLNILKGVTFLFNKSLLKSVQSAIAEHPDKRVLSLSFENKKYFIKRRRGNGRNAFAKQNPSAAFWCEAYKIMTVNARLRLAPKLVLLDEDFFVMEAAGKTLQGVAKEAEYADVRQEAFEKAGQGLARLHAAGLHHGRPCGTSPTTGKTGRLPSSIGKTKRNSSTRRHRSWTCSSSYTAVSAKNGRTTPSSMRLSPVMAASKAATRSSRR